MADDPYQPPSSSGNSKPGNSRSTVVEQLLPAILGPALAIAWIIAILFGWKTTNKFLFHVIFGTLVLLPSVATLVFAFSGRCRTPNPNTTRKFANLIGTVGFVSVGVFGLFTYIIALYCKG